MLNGSRYRSVVPWKDYQTSCDDICSSSGSNRCSTTSSSSSSNNKGKEREILAEISHCDLVELRKRKEAEIEGLFRAQTVLRQKEGNLGKLLVEMEDEKERLEQELMLVLLNTEVLDG